MKPQKIQISYNGDEWTALVVLTDINRAAPACRASLAFFGDPIMREDDSDEQAVYACLKMFARTLAKCIQDHFKHNKDEIYAKAKSVTAAWTTPLLAHK
jgi:phage host-nuclease inhibitor protein Gam